MSEQHNFSSVAERESGLVKRLTQPQLTMIALGSGAAIHMAGPSVILSYAIGAFVALLLMGCLGEMVVAHPTTGSFGMNAQLYVTTRMIFSLSRSGQAPHFLGKVSRNGVPQRSLWISTIGVALAAICSVAMPGASFVLVMSISMFGALFAWFMIFVTHYRFRRACERNSVALSFRIPGFPILTIIGAILMICIIATTFFIPDMRMTLITGVPLLLVLSVVYAFIKKKKHIENTSIGDDVRT